MGRLVRLGLSPIVAGAVIAAGAGIGGAVATPDVAHAAGGPLISCVNVAGTLLTTDDPSGAVTWSLNAEGVCTDVLFGTPELVTVSGTATSVGRGYCTGGLVTTDLTFAVNLTFEDLATRTLRSQTESWTVPLTPGTVALPFVASGGATGAGTMFTRIFAQCPGADGTGGTPVATLDWVQD